MNRREFLKVSGVAAATLFLSDCLRAHNDDKQIAKPNVLFIAVDDLRPELGCYGNEYVKSPNIDDLASSGVVFNRTYCQQAVCNPSRASLLTGLRPDSIGVWDLRTDFRDNVPDVVTLPQYFKDNGYYVSGIGKIFHNDIPDTVSWDEKKYIDGFPFDPDAVYLNKENLEVVEKKKRRIIELGKQEGYIDPLGEWYIKTVSTEIADAPDNAYFDGAQTDWAIDRLADLKDMDKPFFLAVGYYRPHLPFNAPRRYWDMYKRKEIPLAENNYLPKNSPSMAMNHGYELHRSYMDFKGMPMPHKGSLAEEQIRLLKHGYLASVSYIDAQIGRLMNALDSRGLRENTIVILWGDHGWKLGEHNSWCKQTNYEIDVRVPMIISAPGMKAAGKTSNALTEFVDIYPTLADLTGLPFPKHLHGKSVVSLLDEPDKKWKTAAFSQFLRGVFEPMPDGKRYMGYAIRTDRYRYIEWYEWLDGVRGDYAARELYDHETDPEENENVSENPENANVVAGHSEMLKAGWRVGLPQPACRSRLQTAVSGFG